MSTSHPSVYFRGRVEYSILASDRSCPVKRSIFLTFVDCC